MRVERCSILFYLVALWLNASVYRYAGKVPADRRPSSSLNNFCALVFDKLWHALSLTVSVAYAHLYSCCAVCLKPQASSLTTVSRTPTFLHYLLWWTEEIWRLSSIRRPSRPISFPHTLQNIRRLLTRDQCFVLPIYRILQRQTISLNYRDCISRCVISNPLPKQSTVATFIVQRPAI